jgi:hypothetical protein
MAEKSGALTSKDYEVKRLEIVASGGQPPIDIRTNYVQLQIFQDLYSSVMSGNILINDGSDLFSNFFFCGNEYLRVIIDKPGLGIPIDKLFRIYKATDRAKSGNSSQKYVLHFCSDELLLSNSTLVSKAYKNLSATDIIADILTEYLQVPSKKISSIEETSGVFDIVIPSYRPMEAIQWLTSLAYKDGSDFCYFFFENSKGFNLKSLHSMYKNTAVKKLKFELKNTDSPDTATNRDSIEKFKIINDFDSIMGTTNGAFASRLLAVDIFSQKFDDYLYSVDQAEGENLLLNKYKTVNSLPQSDGISQTQAYNSLFKCYAVSRENDKKKQHNIDKWMMRRAQHMSLINTFKFEAVIPGDTSMNVGDVVQFDFPKFVAPDESGKQNDEFRTGKYLVSAINHRFSEDNYVCIAEFCSDSFSKQLPTASSNATKAIRDDQ